MFENLLAGIHFFESPEWLRVMMGVLTAIVIILLASWFATIRHEISERLLNTAVAVLAVMAVMMAAVLVVVPTIQMHLQ